VTAAEIAQKLGGTAPSGEWWRCRCPLHNGSSSSLALRDTVTGIAIKCFAGCHRWGILQELARRGLVRAPREDPKAGRAIAAEKEDEKRRIAHARDMWNASYPADATTQIDTYFHCRGIALPPPPTLRIHGMTYHSESGESRPAMAARIDHVERGHTGTHLTFLAITGECKATIEPNRKMFGLVAGGAVRLAAIEPDKWLIIGEGLESTLSAMQLTGLAGWAALSATGIEQIVLPPEAGRIIIAADNDMNGRGREAAEAAAQRFAKEGRKVRISMPPHIGQDFNDVLLAGEGRHAIGQ
jgi:putative DNA primase/helicase